MKLGKTWRNSIKLNIATIKFKYLELSKSLEVVKMYLRVLYFFLVTRFKNMHMKIKLDMLLKIHNRFEFGEEI